MDMMNPAGPRIAIYSQDGYGLGHMRRTSAIAWQIVQMRPDASILTLSDSQLGQFFPISPNHDYLKLPSIVKKGPGEWQASHLAMPFEDILEMRRQLIRSALLSFAPHILLVDHMPHGAMGELIPALQALKEMGYPTRVILGLRDILDDPAVIRHHWYLEGAFDAIQNYYHRILVYGMRDLYDITEQYTFPPFATSLVRYCGYVCSQDLPARAAEIRARYLTGSPAGTRLIVAMAGGGADAYTMMTTLLEAMQDLEQPPAVYPPQILALITGPFMPPAQLARLSEMARHLPVRIMESVDDSISYIAAADLVIAMAGYNTTAEILRLRKPAILIPRAGPSAEQRTRARLFAERSWVDIIDPDDLTPGLLSQEISFRMAKPSEVSPHCRPDLHGATVAANHILSHITAEKVAGIVEK